MKLKKNIYLMYAIVLLQGMVFYGPIATLYRIKAARTPYESVSHTGYSSTVR